MSGITRDENGAYRWYGVIDSGYERKTFQIVFGVCGGICVLFLIMSAVLGGEMLRVTLLSSLGVMAVAGGVCWLFGRNAGHRTQGYIMTEDSVLFMQRRANAPIFFGSVRKAVVYPARDMIELFEAAGSGPVFAPHEDFAFVKDFILQRLPRAAVIEYR